MDMFLLFVSFVGVYMIGVGFQDESFKHKDGEKADLTKVAPPLWALIGLLILPFF